MFTKTEINEKDVNGHTPLLLAGKLAIHDAEYLKAVNIMIEAEAKVKVKDRQGWTLSEIARANRNTQLYSIIFYAKH